MIQLTNTNNLYTYIVGEYITVAQNNSVTLNFIEDSLVCPLNNITPSSLILPIVPTNLTAIVVNSTLDCTPDPDINNTRTFYYEIINPKVIYHKVDKTSQIVFTDVSSVPTFSHTHSIPVLNNTWIRNPFFNRGRIEIQRFDTLTSAWVNVGYLPLNGTLVVNSLPDEVCQYRAILRIHEIVGCGGVSPVTFEAIGDTFTVKGGYYEEDNPYIKEINGELYKHYYCKKDKVLTVELDKHVEVLFDTYNDHYIYEYYYSNTNITLPSFVYNSASKSLIGSGDAPLACFNAVVNFYGCSNEFIDGILTTTTCVASPSIIPGEYSDEYSGTEYFTDQLGDPLVDPNTYVETLEFRLEIVRPNILSTTQLDCSYCFNIQDGTILCNPCLLGLVEYEYKTPNGLEWCKLKTVNPETLFNHCFCNEDPILLRNRYSYLEKGCGCNPDTLVFETDWYEYTIDPVEYKPSFDLQDTDCCYIEGSGFTIQPTNLDLNASFCNNRATLTYFLYEWNKDVKIWEEIGETRTVYNINDTVTGWDNLEQYIFTLNQLKLQAYKIVATLSNCCYTSTVERYINICPALQIVRDCDTEFIKDNRSTDTLPCDCQLYHITNHSTTDSYELKIYHTGYKALTDTIIIAPLDSIEYKFTDDGIYTLTVKNLTNLNVEDYVLTKYVFCIIDKCYTDILKDILCSFNPDCMCEDQELIKDQSRLRKIMAMYQTWMRLIEKDYNLTVRYTPVDVTFRLKEFEENHSLYQKILTFCKPCVDGNKNCCG
jgi:hypothetical protein